uniref:GBF-interacting protein 1 N-terminal domain-containing protein n=2 Tax=Oryza brachyantha TaxID=4533 RepID=J3M9T2_ORYBR
MDPDEAVSRLLSQDTFQEVKSKRDKKKEVKEIPEPRSRATSNAASRGVRGGTDRGGRNSSFHSSSIDNVASRSISGPGMTSINPTQKQTVPSSSVNKSVVADGPSVPPQSSSGFQHGWSGTPGQLSMADIVKMGRPQAKQSSSKPAVSADKGYAGQYPSLPTTVNQNLKQSATTVLPTDPDQGLHSAQDSIHVKDHNLSAAVNKQTYDNDWLLVDRPKDEPQSGNQSALPETSGDQSLYESSLQSSTLVAGVINPHENSHFDENKPAAIASVNASERHLEHHGGNSEYNDELLQDSSTYLPQKNSLTEDEVEDSNADVDLATENFQGLILHNEELVATKLAEDNPAVIIPDHLQVTGSDCVTLSFGSFESGAFSGLLPVPSRIPDDNNVLPVLEESVPIDQIDSRDQDYYDSGTVTSPGNENHDDSIIGSNMENLDVPSVSQPDVLRQEVLDHAGLQYNLPSDSSAAYANTTQPSTMDSSQGNAAHTLSHLSNLLQANSLHNSLLGSNIAPLRDLDFTLSPLLAAQSMATKYNSAAPTTTGPAISMQEALKPGVFSNTQSTQNLPSTSVPTGPPLPQQLVHPYSQPTVPLAPFANMIGYPYLAQNYPAAYLPSAAFQQAYSSNGPFHQSPAAAVPGGAMKYNMNVLPQQYKNNLSATSLQQQPSSVISGYGGFGSSSNLQGNFNLNQNAASASTNLGFDEALSTPYKDPNQYMALQQGDNSAMWLHGAGSRATSAVPPSHFYGFQGQSQQGGFRQAQQPQQHSQFGGHGYPAFYHSQSGLTQEHHQNPAEGGGLNGFQSAQSQPSHQGWQQHTGY